MPDIFLRQGQANPSDIALTDPTTLGSANTTGTIVASQAAQTGSLTAVERFIAAAAVAQPVQTGSIAAVEVFRLASAASQPAQTGALVAVEAFRLASAASQPVQTGALVGVEEFRLVSAASQPAQAGSLVGAQEFSGALAVAQPAQTGALAAVEEFSGAVAASQAAQSGNVAAIQRSVGAVAGAQSAQFGAILAIHTPNQAQLVTVQPAQTGSLTASGAAVGGGPGYSLAYAPRKRRAAALPRPVILPPYLPDVTVPSVAAMVTSQPSQSARLTAFTSDDELVLLLAA